MYALELDYNFTSGANNVLEMIILVRTYRKGKSYGNVWKRESTHSSSVVSVDSFVMVLPEDWIVCGMLIIYLLSQFNCIYALC